MDSPQSRKRRRPRPVVSCLRCRDKKLKCDRATPCQNCIKAICAAECTYNQHPATNSPDHHPPAPKPKPKRVQLSISEESDQRVRAESPRSFGVIEDLQRRVVHLEELVGARPISTNEGYLRDATIQKSWPQQTPSPSTATPLQGTLVIKGSRSRYHGQNNRITLLNQFPDAKTFINQCGTDSGLVGLAKEVQFLQSKAHAATASPASLSDLESFPELQCLLDSLPPKSLCDHLVDVYTKNFERTWRIIHVPSFLRQYSRLWEENPDHSFTRDFVPLLTAVLAIAVAVLTTLASTEHSHSWRYLKEDAPSNVQAWLKKLPRKQRTEIATLQTETLLLLSRQLRLVEPEELWKASGELVRSAMVMGLHINTRTSTKITPYQAECRKRLWITIAEMDLQMSISSGMPVMTPGLDFEPLTPANLNDSDFDETTETLPPPRDLSEETDSLYQICFATSLSQRIRAIKMAQHTNPDESLEKRWKQTQILEESFGSSPLGLDRSNQLGEIDSSGRVLHRVILDVFLHRPILALLQPLVISDSHRDHPSFTEVQQAFVKYSLSILSYQDYFDPNISELDLFNLSDASWEIFQAFFQHDILSAALNVCEYMRQLNNTQTHQGAANTNRSTSLTLLGQPISKVSLIRLVENILDTLTRRIAERGTNVKDVLLLAVVLQSARGRGTKTQQDQLMSQGARKALSACRQHLISKQSEESIPNAIPEASQMPTSPYVSMGASGQQSSASHSTHLADFFDPSSTLAADFNNFESDLFTFDDGSFLWNL